MRKFDASERGEFSWKAFAEGVRDGGLFSEKRCVIVENVSALLEDEKEKFKKWLESKDSPKDNAEVLCIACDTKPDKRTTLFKTLQKKAEWREFPSLSPDEFLRYARALANEKFPSIVFERGVLESVARGCGSDLFRLENELEKLSAYAGSEKKVTQASADVLCSSGVFDEIFGALEAIGRGDKKTALTLLSRQVKKGEHPIYLLTMCAYQIRTMLLVGECLEKGISQPALVAREAKIHPFVAGKTISAMQVFGMTRARNAFALLGRLDTAIKTGKIDAGLAVEEFVIRS